MEDPLEDLACVDYFSTQDALRGSRGDGQPANTRRHGPQGGLRGSPSMAVSVVGVRVMRVGVF